MTETTASALSGAHDASSDFLFVGDSLALDFVNTAIVVRGQPRDLLAAPADLLAWQHAVTTRSPGSGWAMGDPSLVADEITLTSARAFRDALRGLFNAVIAGAPAAEADLEALNRVLRAGFLTVETETHGQFRQISGSHDPGPDGMLLPIARSAMALLTGSDPSRLHRCANERCVLLFYDTTKSATRRWCSTGCMNRARSSRRYRERRAATLPG